jgi:Uncharacterised nucleotidyltransferase
MIPSPLIRRFARLAWPGPSIDLLLRAATLSDAGQAAAAWRGFEASADFDALTWGQLRLISLAARRISALAPDSPMRPRISGIERSIWSRSHMVVSEAKGVLRRLSDEGVAMLAIKGAGRTASGEAAARGRIVNDIDIVVQPDDLNRAFDILSEEGWIPAGSGSALYQRTQLGQVTGINFVRGEFGNFDLHRTAFHPPHAAEGEDAGLWDRSQAGILGGTPVGVPSPLDTILIAIAHGALGAHKSSDWLADAAQAMDEGEVDWDLLVAIAKKRRLSAAALTALGYLRNRLGRPVPDTALAALEREAAAHPLQLAGAIAESRPKSGRIDLSWLARATAKQGRLLRGRRRQRGERSPLVFARPFGRATPDGGEGNAAGLETPLVLVGREAGQSWSGRLDMRIEAMVPAASRRIEFEINCGDRHIMRLRAIARDKGARALPLRFRVRIDIAAQEPDPVLLAVPARSFNTKATQGELDRYGAVRFRMVSCEARRDGA